MDSEERHELKENDLAELLRDAGAWFSQHGTKLLLVLILIALSFTAYNFYTTSIEQAYENAWADLASATTPEDYLLVARSHDQPTVQALAYLRGGDLFLRRAIGRYEELDLNGVGIENDPANDPANDPTANDDRSPEDDLSQAAALYQRVLDADADTTPTAFRVNALIGLGAVAESRRAWDDARAHYQQAIELAADHLPPLRRQAQRRLDLLDELRRPIVFGPETEAPQPPAGVGMPPTEARFDLWPELPETGTLEEWDLVPPEGFGERPTDDEQDADLEPTDEPTDEPTAPANGPAEAPAEAQEDAVADDTE